MSVAESIVDTPPARWHGLADRVLAGGTLDRDEARTILESTDAELLDVLAAAYASAGQFDHAVESADAALKLGPPDPLAAEIRRRRDLYRRHERFVAPVPKG